MDGNISLCEAHHTATQIENKLKDQYGQDTHIGIHVEPIKSIPKTEDIPASNK